MEEAIGGDGKKPWPAGKGELEELPTTSTISSERDILEISFVKGEQVLGSVGEEKISNMIENKQNRELTFALAQP